MQIYLTDTQQTIDYALGVKSNEIQWLLEVKKIIPSIMDLLEPILPENQDFTQVKWQAQSQDMALFQKIHQSWLIMELRLTQVERTHSTERIKQLLQQAQRYRLEKKQANDYTAIELDYLFLLQLHSEIDALLVNIGERFYLPTYRQFWHSDMAHLSV